MMKIRTDFVTNSSSSSFIIARKEELTEKQKNAILDFVLSTFLSGDEFTLENFDKMLEDHYVTEENVSKIKEALASGQKVYLGYVGFDDAEYSYGELFESLWNQLANADPENFTGISTDLSY